jgi:hypothetical protein
MMERITIEVADDGRVTVTAESAGEAGDEMETMDFDSVEEAAGAVRELMLDAVEDTGEMEGEQPDMESMWNEEASKRPPQSNLMT